MKNTALIGSGDHGIVNSCFVKIFNTRSKGVIMVVGFIFTLMQFRI